jgi:hypothetical protein
LPWACGDGINKPSQEDIHNRVLELTDPAKFAAKQEKEQRKSSETASTSTSAADADAEAPEAPKNLIASEPETRPAPNWKDVSNGMAALFHEGCKQQPRHSSDMMRDFAKRLAWTMAMVKGLTGGIADNKYGERANASS